MPPKERGVRKIISAKMLQNGSESKMNHQNMIESSKTLEVEITNGKDVNETEKSEEIMESNTNFINKAVPLKRGRKKANASTENEVMSTNDDIIPVVNNDVIESLDKQSKESVTTESTTEDENGSELSKDNDKLESNEVDVLDDKNKKIPLRRGRQKKVKGETSDQQFQTKEKAPEQLPVGEKTLSKQGQKNPFKPEDREIEDIKANISLEKENLSDLKKTDDDHKELTEKDEQLQADEKILPKRGRKKANPPDNKEIQGRNNAVEKDKLFDVKNDEENIEGPSEKMSEEQLPAEEKLPSRRGRKKANPVKPDKKKNEDSNDAVDEDKLSDLKKIDENNEGPPGKIDENNEGLPSKIDENYEVPHEKNSEVQVPAEEKTQTKRGRKKANVLNSDEKKIDSSDEKPSDTIPDKQIETGDKIKSKRGRKKAIGLSKSDESPDLKAMKEELSEKESSSSTKVQINEKNVSSEEQSMSLRRGRSRVNEKETVKAFTKKPSQDIINKKKPEKNIEVAKKNTRGAKNKTEASSHATKLLPVSLKRRNETAAEEVEKNKEEFNENKVLKVRLQRDDTIDKMCEEETKITQVGKAKNTKAGDKRAKEEDSKDSEETSAKKPKGEPKSKGQSKKDKMPDVTLLDFNNNSTSPTGKPWNLKISSWNVNGIRAWLEKDGLAYITHENPDVIALQETKCSDKMLPKEVNIAGYHAYWLAGDKDGYSGVGLLSKKEPVSVSYGIGVEEHDKEGRVITAEYEEFYLVTAYIPNSGRGLVRLDYRMEWDKDFKSYIKNLDGKKPVILCGDLNVAHEEIDLANPKTNKKNAGFTKEEREGFSTLLSEGFIDSFRHLYPDEKGAYTFWTYMMNARAKNVGWRLDYFVLSKKLTDHLCDNVIRKDVFGSDHCPITLFLSV